MSLFINDLAFRGTAQGDEVKLAVFAGSLASAAGGLAILWASSRGATRPVTRL
jgi:Na+/H+ antiporter NhaA